MFLITVVRTAFRVMEILLLIRILMSWIPNLPYNAFTAFIYDITEPLLRPFRSLLAIGPIDFSPIIAFLLLGLVEQLVVQLLVGIIY